VPADELPDRCDALVIGAGLAGMAAARHLSARGRQTHVREAGDAVGHRVRTDAVDGFLCDRGFHVLKHIGACTIPRALPAMVPPSPLRRSVKAGPPGSGLFVCRDHRDTPSIQGAPGLGPPGRRRRPTPGGHRLSVHRRRGPAAALRPVLLRRRAGSAPRRRPEEADGWAARFGVRTAAWRAILWAMSANTMPWKGATLRQ
jgi:Flavin containing amine oxidoreductase